MKIILHVDRHKHLNAEILEEKPYKLAMRKEELFMIMKGKLLMLDCKVRHFFVAKVYKL